MSQKIIVDTDHILTVSSKIHNTASEISNSIMSLQKLSTDLSTDLGDKNMNNFKMSFDDYLSKLTGLVTFYTNITTNLNYLAKEFDGMDNDDATELKKIVNDDTNV